MPSFTIEAADLTAEGPVVEVTFGVPVAVSTLLQENKEPVPAPVRVDALIDTGASHTVVQEGVAAKLGLNPTGATTITTPSSQGHPCLLYFVRLVLPKGLWIETTVIEAPLQGQNIEALIGRDVLGLGVLIYQGHNSQFTLSF